MEIPNCNYNKILNLLLNKILYKSKLKQKDNIFNIEMKLKVLGSFCFSKLNEYKGMVMPLCAAHFRIVFLAVATVCLLLTFVLSALHAPYPNPHNNPVGEILWYTFFYMRNEYLMFYFLLFNCMNYFLVCLGSATCTPAILRVL